uniref:Uncharacterized protein n=1 Tax=Megaselia scalaris TaxID=36166 RepID=T1GSZ8_MEGSC
MASRMCSQPATTTAEKLFLLTGNENNGGANMAVRNNTMSTWHQRMCHQNKDNLHYLPHITILTGTSADMANIVYVSCSSLYCNAEIRKMKQKLSSSFSITM